MLCREPGGRPLPRRRDAPYGGSGRVGTAGVSSRGHGRAQTRTVKVIGLAGRTGSPYAVQAVRVRRHIRDLRTGKVSWTVAYAVTSLEVGRVGAARIGALVRGHWNVEAWHHVKDVSLDEDAGKARSGHGPDDLAALRALAPVLVGRLGQDTLPVATRWVSHMRRSLARWM